MGLEVSGSESMAGRTHLRLIHVHDRSTSPRSRGTLAARFALEAAQRDEFDATARDLVGHAIQLTGEYCCYDSSFDIRL